VAGIVLVLTVVVGLFAAPAGASGPKAAPAWKWTKEFSLGSITGLKKSQPYGAYGLTCPSSKLCVVPMAGTGVKAPYFSPAGDFFTKTPAKGASGWKFSKWNEDYAPGDSLSVESVACDPAGAKADCIIAGREPVPGSFNESYGATVFQTGQPTDANWGAADVDSSSAGFGGVSCWANVQCAEIDDNGVVYTTAGATVTSAKSVFPGDAGFAGIWSIGCAPYLSGQHNFFCAAVDQNAGGSIAWTVNPGQSDTKWKVVNLKHGDTLFDVACYRPGTCIINNNGSLVATTGDTAAGSWVRGFKKITLPKGVSGSISTLACNAELCAVAGRASKVGQYVSISTNPYRGRWQTIPLSKTGKTVLRDGIAFVSCPTVKLCVVGNADGQTTVGTLK
jgi:hypothetical protein